MMDEATSTGEGLSSGSLVCHSYTLSGISLIFFVNLLRNYP